jgi:hypothetical protein
MAAPTVLSDEDLYKLTGSWDAAAVLRDEQNKALNEYNWSQGSAPAAEPVVEKPKAMTLSATPTLAELKAMYEQLGSTQARENYTEQGTTVDYLPVQYGGGWSSWEKAPVQIGMQGDGMDAQPIFSDKKELGGFTKQEGDWVTSYDLAGNVVDRHKWNENMLKSTIKDLGPMALMALTAGGGNALIGNSLFGLTGTAAATAGGALAGGVNAWGNDQDILKGALLGGVSGAGSAKLTDILGADTVGQTFKNATVGDVKKAIDFAQNPTLTGAANIASPYVTTNFNIGDTGFTTGDVLKGVTAAKDLSSGDYSKMFKAITGLAGNATPGGLTADEQAQLAANRETKRLNKIEDAVLNQPASDDGSTQGILDLISEMYPTAGVKGMTEGELTKFLEANINDIQGSAELETLLKSQPAAGDDTVNITGDRPTGLGDFMLPTDNVSNVADKGEMVITGNRNGTSLDDFLNLNAPAGNITNNYTDDLSELVVTGNKNGTSLDDFISLNTPAGNILNNYADDTVFVTGNKDADVDELVVTDKKECAPGFHDDGTGLCVADDDEEKPTDCPDGYILDLETNQCVKVDDTGVIKTVPPTKKITTTPPKTTTKTAEDLMGSLGLGRQAPSQDPYANIKLMEELFGGDVGYKLRALGAPKNLASSDMDALVKLLRG